MSDERGPRWRSICGAEVVWDRWGFGVEFSFMHWAPPEISMYIHVGPLLIGLGVEERFEWRYPESAARVDALLQQMSE